MNLNHNLRIDHKGISTVFGMVFFLLIVMVVFASLIIVLNQNTGLEQTVIQTRQLDNNRANEILTVSMQANGVSLYTVNAGAHSVTVNVILNNTGTLPVELARLWVKDLTNMVSASTVLSVAEGSLRQGQANPTYSGVVTFPDTVQIRSTDQFIFWFVTSRGNQFTLDPSATLDIQRGISSVFGDFIPDYHSVQWASVTTTGGVSSPGQWQTGWIIPSTVSIQKVAFRLNVTYYGSSTIRIDDDTNIWFNNLQQSSIVFENNQVSRFSNSSGTFYTGVYSTLYLSNYNQGALSLYKGHEITVQPSSNPVPLTLYFSTIQNWNADDSGTFENWRITPYLAPSPVGYPLNCISPNAQMSLVLYGMSPSTYAQTFSLFAAQTRAISLQLNPTSGVVGTPITVTGTGFAAIANTQITLTSDLSSPITFTSSTGSFTRTFVVQAATAGFHTVTATDNSPSNNAASATFIVTPEITSINPTIGASGTSITVAGHGFAANSDLTVIFGGSEVDPSPTNAVTDEAGSFSNLNFNAPSSSTAGAKIVTVIDASGYSDSITFNLVLTATINVPTLNPSSNIGFGASVTCSVVVSGGGVTPTGTVQFQCSINSGTTWANLGGAVALSGGSATSISYTPAAMGSNYQFRISSYSGDSNYNAVGTASSPITLTVTQATTVTGTTLSNPSRILGQSVIDTATVSAIGSGATPTGSVTFQASTDGGTIFTQYGAVKSLSSGSATSDAYTATNVGIFYFRAVYGGDINYVTSQSGSTAEPLTITQATATVGGASFVPAGPISLGTDVTVSASVTGPVGITVPTGNVQFQVKIGAAGYVNFGSPVALSSSSASIAYTPQSAATYNFRAVYQGDSNYASATTGAASGTLTVNGLTTTVGAASFAPASPINLGATVTVSGFVTGPGGFPAPTGNVQFQVSINGGAYANFGSLAALSSGSASIIYTPLSATTYNFRAVYQGDGIYAAGTIGASSGTLTVDKATLTVNVPTLNPSTIIGYGNSVTSSVVVSGGGATPTGSVQFQVSINSGSSWSNLGSAVALSGGLATSTSYTPTAIGSNYQFRVSSYTGDSNYNSVATASSAVTLTVTQSTPPTSTVLSFTTRTLGQSVTDTATVSAIGSGVTPTGTIIFEVSTNGGTTFTQYGAAKPLSSGSATSDAYTPANVGTFYFRAIYSGNANYLTSQSGNTAEPLTVTAAQVTYVSSSTTFTGSANGNPTANYPSTMQLNDLIILQVAIRGDTSGVVITPPAGFTLLSSFGPEATGGTNSRVTQWLYYKFSNGVGESGTAAITIAGGNGDRLARMYAFRDVALSAFYEGAGTFTVGDSASASPQSITTTGANRLAVSFMSVASSVTVGPFNGANGWTEAIAEARYDSGGTGNDGVTLQLQIATMPNAATISGGTATLGSSERWGVRSFALSPG